MTGTNPSITWLFGNDAMERGMVDRRPGRAQGQRVREVTRARLLATAEEIFLTRGYGATTVDAVAFEAGFTTGAVYSNFGGKADLFLAVLEATTTRELTDIRQAIDAARTDEERLAVFTAAIEQDPVRWRTRMAATIEFLSEARRRPELLARLREAQRLADRTVAEVLDALCRSLGAEPPADPAELTREVTALLNGLALRSLYDEDFDVAAAVSRGVSSLLTANRLVAQQPPFPRADLLTAR